jgi:MFS family permease
LAYPLLKHLLSFQFQQWLGHLLAHHGAGPLTEYGRRNIAVIGLIGYSVSIIALITPLFLVEQKILDLVYLLPLLVLGRLINGLIGSATRPAAFAYMADITDRSKRTKNLQDLNQVF